MCLLVERTGAEAVFSTVGRFGIKELYGIKLGVFICRRIAVHVEPEAIHLVLVPVGSVTSHGVHHLPLTSFKELFHRASKSLETLRHIHRCLSVIAFFTIEWKRSRLAAHVLVVDHLFHVLDEDVVTDIFLRGFVDEINLCGVGFAHLVVVGLFQEGERAIRCRIVYGEGVEAVVGVDVSVGHPECGMRVAVPVVADDGAHRTVLVLSEILAHEEV